jgi:hypothetical protein
VLGAPAGVDDGQHREYLRGPLGRPVRGDPLFIEFASRNQLPSHVEPVAGSQGTHRHAGLPHEPGGEVVAARAGWAPRGHVGRFPHVPPHVRDAALLSGWNAKQVSTFLGHEDAGFTLRTYVWVLGEDLPSPTFGSWDTPTPAPAEAETVGVGQVVGETRTPETARNGLALVGAEDGSDSAIVSGGLAVVGASR